MIQPTKTQVPHLYTNTRDLALKSGLGNRDLHRTSSNPDRRFLRAASPPLWRLNTASGYHQIIQAVPREQTGCSASSKERAAGRVPSVVLTPRHGGVAASNKQILTTDANQIRELLKQSPFFCSTPIKLQVHAGPGSAVVLQSGTVVPTKVHLNKETGQVMNLVLQWVEERSFLKVNVPFLFKGEDVCPGLKKGGYLHKIRSSLKYLCPSENIPQKIEVDLSNLDIGDTIYVQEVGAHPSLKLLSKDSDERMPICKILAMKPEESEPKVRTQGTEMAEAEKP